MTEFEIQKEKFDAHEKMRIAAAKLMSITEDFFTEKKRLIGSSINSKVSRTDYLKMIVLRDEIIKTERHLMECRKKLLAAYLNEIQFYLNEKTNKGEK